MKFKTKISATKDGRHFIRGNDIVELMKTKSFVEVVFLLLRGDFPQENEKKLLEALLVAAVENGVEAPSLYVPRIVAASGNSSHVALAAGMLSIGERHGGAAEKAAMLLNSGKSAKEIVEQEKIVPGFGHRVYKEEDPRAKVLYEKAKELGFPCRFFGLAYEIEKELAAQKSKKLPLNIDGALACTMLELGFDPKLGKPLFLLSRVAGMSAHVLEEMRQDNSYYRLGEEDVEYEA